MTSNNQQFSIDADVAAYGHKWEIWWLFYFQAQTCSAAGARNVVGKKNAYVGKRSDRITKRKKKHELRTKIMRYDKLTLVWNL